MKSKKQTVFVQMLAFFTAALSVIFLRQYQLAKSHQKGLRDSRPYQPLAEPAEILLETAEVPLFEEIIVTPVEN